MADHSTAEHPHPVDAEPQADTGFLAEASRLLADSLDYETTLATVAGLSLPYLGAWCIVDHCLNHVMHRVAIVHPDPDMQALARKLESGWPPQQDDPFGVPHAMRARAAEVIDHISDEMLIEVSRSEENLEILRTLGMGSLLVVPLLARGEVLGAITYVSPRGGRTHWPQDVALAEDLAARCAIALDNARLHAKVHDAEGASAAKSQFLAVMSHELRTPLTGALGYAELLEGEVLGPMQTRQREACSRIKVNCWHLVSIIDEILLFSRTESGRLEVRREATDVAGIAREVMEILKPEAVRAGIGLNFECGDEVLPLWTDPGKLRQILLNLSGNAIKYTRQGQIDVIIDRDGSSPGGFQIHIRDTGPGIRPEDQERIFEPFTQADQSLTRAVGGTGLGLTISRRLAQALGGDVTLQSTPGEGSTFTLHLPTMVAGRTPRA